MLVTCKLFQIKIFGKFSFWVNFWGLRKMQVFGNECLCSAKRKTFAMMEFDEIAGFCKVE